MCKDCYYWNRNKEEGFENEGSGSCEHIMSPAHQTMESYDCELCYDEVEASITSRSW